MFFTGMLGCNRVYQQHHDHLQALYLAMTAVTFLVVT